MNKIRYRQRMAHFMRVRFWKRKQQAIAYKGGKCSICGYSKCPDALIFHHRDPKEKEFDWNRAKRLSWEKTIKELDKCDILCCRCHVELHHKNNGDVEESIKWLNDNTIKPPQRSALNICKQCGGTIVSKEKRSFYCSRECVRQSQIKTAITDSELISLVEATSKSAVARQFGVSDKAIGKRYRYAKQRL